MHKTFNAYIVRRKIWTKISDTSVFKTRKNVKKGRIVGKVKTR